MESPKKNLKNPSMAFYDSHHKNEIDYYRKLANVMRNQNMQSFFRMDARIKI